MKSIFMGLSAAAILVMLVSGDSGDSGDKHFPDVSCHPTYDDNKWSPGSVQLAKMFWQDWQKDEKEQKMCAKLCMLGAFNMVYMEPKRTGPVQMDLDFMTDYMSNENGYKGGESGGHILIKTRQNLDESRVQHLDTVRNYSVWEVPYEPKWTPFLDCIEAAFGCKRGPRPRQFKAIYLTWATFL